MLPSMTLTIYPYNEFPSSRPSSRPSLPLREIICLINYMLPSLCLRFPFRGGHKLRIVDSLLQDGRIPVRGGCAEPCRTMNNSAGRGLVGRLLGLLRGWISHSHL